MTIIKNAIVYKVDLPEARALTARLEELPYSELSEVEFSKTTFVANPLTAELVTPTHGGYAFTVQHDCKIIPPQSVSAETRKRVKTIESHDNSKLSGDEISAIKETVMADFTKVALIKSSFICCFYSEKNKLLIINTASKSLSQLAVNALIKCIGSIKPEAINVSNLKLSVTAKTKEYITSNYDASVFAGFSVGDKIKLSKTGDKKESVNFNGIDADHNETLLDYFKSGYSVDFIQLEALAMRFKLDASFNFKSISFGEIELDDDEDRASAWRKTAASEMFFICDAVEKLALLLDYKNINQPDIFNSEKEETK